MSDRGSASLANPPRGRLLSGSSGLCLPLDSGKPSVVVGTAAVAVDVVCRFEAEDVEMQVGGDLEGRAYKVVR